MPWLSSPSSLATRSCGPLRAPATTVPLPCGATPAHPQGEVQPEPVPLPASANHRVLAAVRGNAYVVLRVNGGSGAAAREEAERVRR